MDVDDIYSKYAYRFLEIGNMQQAAIDVGVPKDSVNEFLGNTKEHPDVIQILMEDELATPNFNDPKDVRAFILKKLWRESNYRGPGSQQAARIAALKNIGEIVGIEAGGKGNPNAAAANGGMLMVPMMDAALWEESAERMQRELKERARDED